MCIIQCNIFSQISGKQGGGSHLPPVIMHVTKKHSSASLLGLKVLYKQSLKVFTFCISGQHQVKSTLTLHYCMHLGLAGTGYSVYGENYFAVRTVQNI